MKPILDVRQYTKQFELHILNNKRIDALSNVSFQVDAGEIVGLVGKSGSGKSTLMKSVYRTYLATGGAIVYNSLRYGPLDLVRATDHQIIALRRDEITYCSQFLSVIPRVSAIDVVAENLFRRGVSRDEARNESRSYLYRLGLPEELWDAYPATFSGGEQQRINVARSIIARPRLLLIAGGEFGNANLPLNGWFRVRQILQLHPRTLRTVSLQTAKHRVHTLQELFKVQRPWQADHHLHIC